MGSPAGGNTGGNNGPGGAGRRDLIKRSAALGLVSVPTMSLLSACASGGSGAADKAEAGERTAKNPLGVNDSAQMEFVLFDGGFGKEYAEDAVRIYETNFPRTTVRFSATQKIQSTLQPRFNQGTPPDLIDNSGAEQMDMGVLAGKDQLADLTLLLDAPSYDDPAKKVRDTLRPGIAEMGRFDGAPVRALYYAYTVYGVWYSRKALDALDERTPRPGTRCSPCARRPGRREWRAGRTRASTRTTCPSRCTR